MLPPAGHQDVEGPAFHSFPNSRDVAAVCRGVISVLTLSSHTLTGELAVAGAPGPLAAADPSMELL